MSCADWVCECGYFEEFRGSETEKACPKCGEQMFCEWDERDDHYPDPEDEDEDDA